MSATNTGEGIGTAPEGWAPVDACTLPTAELPLRVAEFDAVFETGLRSVERLAPTWLRWRFDPDPQLRVEIGDLIDRESECCAFFDFRLGTADGDLVVDVRVPSGRVDVIDGLERQTRAASERAGRRP